MPLNGQGANRPKQLMPKPSRLKAVPTSSIRQNPSKWQEAEER